MKFQINTSLSFKLSLLMMMAICLVWGDTVYAQTPGWNRDFIPDQGPEFPNTSNVETVITSSADAAVLNSAMVDFTNPGAGTPPGIRETVAAIVWGTTTDDIFLFVEHAVKDVTSASATCYTNPITTISTGAIQISTGTALHPDVIIRDHPNNPGVDYIVSVVYTENNSIYLEEFEISGLTHGTTTAISITPWVNPYNSQSKTLLTTATYPPGMQGAYPKIDGFVNPNNIIGDYYEMEGFAVVWETADGIELQVFDATSAPIYETLIATNNTSYPTMRHTPDVAAIVDVNGTGPLGYSQIACVSFDNANFFLYPSGPDIAVHEYDITSGSFTPINIYNLLGPTPGNGRSRIDGMGIYNYTNGRWALITNSDCTGGKTFTNTNTVGEYIHGRPTPPPNTHNSFHSYTITAGAGRLPGGGNPSIRYEEGNVQYPFGMGSYETPPFPFGVDFFFNTVNANTGLAYDPTLVYNFCQVNNSSAIMPITGYCPIPIDPYVGHYYTLSTSCNSGFDLLGAWADAEPINPGIRYKYTCNGDYNLIGTNISPLVGKNDTPVSLEFIHIYPNPAQDYLYIRLNEDIAPHTLNVYDIYGRLVLKKHIQDQRSAGIALTDFITGMYRIYITDTDGKRHGKTVMVNK